MAVTTRSAGIDPLYRQLGVDPSAGHRGIAEAIRNRARSGAAGTAATAPATASAATATPTVVSNSPNYVSITDPITGQKVSVAPAGQGAYLNAYATYANDAARSKSIYENQYNANVKNLGNTLAQNNATTNANYDNSARQAYVDYMRKQRALPSQLQALGVRGGATESGLLNLYNAYGTEHAANEQQRGADLTSNKQAYDDAIAKLAADRSQYLMDYEKDLAAQKQQAINNQINEYNNEITRFSSSVAQYPTTEDGYKAYEAWIANMEASNDPLKDIKIALIRQQMATQFPEGPDNIGGGGSGGGGGGGGYRRGGYGGGYGSGSDSSSGNDYAAGALGQASLANDAFRQLFANTASKGTKKTSNNATKTSTTKKLKSSGTGKNGKKGSFKSVVTSSTSKSLKKSGTGKKKKKGSFTSAVTSSTKSSLKKKSSKKKK